MRVKKVTIKQMLDALDDDTKEFPIKFDEKFEKLINDGIKESERLGRALSTVEEVVEQEMLKKRRRK
jgi:hypothetical protein